jgi:hypothetical protein
MPGNNQTEEFNNKSGSTSIDSRISFAKPILEEALHQRALWGEGDKAKQMHLMLST